MEPYTRYKDLAEQKLGLIEKQLRDALADEEKAAPFYKKFLGDLINSGIIKQVSNESSILANITRDEERHKRDLAQIQRVIMEYRRMLARNPGIIR